MGLMNASNICSENSGGACPKSSPSVSSTPARIAQKADCTLKSGLFGQPGGGDRQCLHILRYRELPTQRHLSRKVRKQPPWQTESLPRRDGHDQPSAVLLRAITTQNQRLINEFTKNMKINRLERWTLTLIRHSSQVYDNNLSNSFANSAAFFIAWSNLNWQLFLYTSVIFWRPNSFV